MTELIPVRPRYIGGKVTLVVNARDLHTFLQVRRDFSNWIRGRIDEYGFEENTDYATIDSSKLANRRGRGGDQRSKTTISPQNTDGSPIRCGISLRLTAWPMAEPARRSGTSCAGSFSNTTGRHRPWRTGSPRIATASASNRSGRRCPNAARPCSPNPMRRLCIRRCRIPWARYL